MSIEINWLTLSFEWFRGPNVIELTLFHVSSFEGGGRALFSFYWHRGMVIQTDLLFVAIAR